MIKLKQKKKKCVIQKAKMLLLGCLTSVMLSSTACTEIFHGDSVFPKFKSVKAEIVPDSVVIMKLGDSICDIVFSPRKVSLITLKPLERPNDDEETIGGFKIDKKIGSLPKNYFAIMQFLLSDSCSYYDGPFVPTTAFLPKWPWSFPTER